MPRPIVAYVRFMDRISRYTGLFAMYLIFLMMGILLYSSIMKTVSFPPLWTLEAAQFVMVAYYLLGGAFALKDDSHVRMDLVYGRLSPKGRALTDVITIFCMITFLGFLLYGGISSTSYALEYGERSYSAWRPYMAPIKIIMCIGVFLTLLQAIAILFKDIATLRGETLS